jgi:uncharacterized protein (TIGR03437 family)
MRQVRAGWVSGLIILGLALPAHAQTTPDWRRIGNGAVEALLASPAAGPVERVWFAPDGSRLFARTASGSVFETADGEKWHPAAAPTPAAPENETSTLPEGAAAARRHPADPLRLYAFGAQLFRSDDDGASWANLTAFRQESIIGGGMRDIAVSPSNPDEIVVANDAGVWRSVDGGLSWTGLNETLPNLPVRRFAGLPESTRGVRIVARGYGVVEWAPGEKRAWQQVQGADPDAARRGASAALGVEITTTATAGDTIYAGSADGRIWTSTDRGRTWNSPAAADRGPVESIFVDPRDARIAVAARGNRVLRTLNAGQFWDDITADLPDGVIHGVTADRDSGTVYAAGDRGVFSAQVDLNAPAPPGSWTALAGLPQARALDVQLDAGGNQLFVALEGHGVYAAMAPHRSRRPRVVNAADFSARAAAPGGLLSVLGGRVTAARAGGVSFPVLAATDSESQIQVPFTVRGPAVSVALDTARGSIEVPLPVESVSPAIFVDRDATPLVLNADTGVLLDGMNPAQSNSRLQILATGLGAVRPEWPAGRPGPAEAPPEVVTRVAAYLDRNPVEVTRAVLAPGYVGLYLIEIQLPALVNSGSAELYIEAGGHASNRVRITIEP